MRNIIADSSSLILLYKCGAVEFFLDNCCCIVPEHVRDEITAGGHYGSDFFNQCFIKGIFTVKIHSGVHKPDKRLHKGETGVISLYKEGAGEFIIIDDGGGAAFCRDNSIPYINALLAVKIMYLKDILSPEKFSVSYEWLKHNGRYSQNIISWADNSTLHDLNFFL